MRSSRPRESAFASCQSAQRPRDAIGEILNRTGKGGSMAIFEADGKNAIHDGIEHEPGGGRALLDPTDTAMLLLDHQAGLFQTVKDISVAELRANTVMLAKLAALMKLPLITTASEPNGPNGPLMPEIHE